MGLLSISGQDGCGLNGRRCIRTMCLVICAVALSACDSNSPFDRLGEDDKVLANVDGEELWLSEISPMLQDSMSEKDSVFQVQNIVEKWVRDRLIIREAEKNKPEDIDIDQLVEDYRNSLIIHHYEQKMIEERLDTVITEEQLMRFYNANKDQFHNEQDLVRAYVIKLKKPFPNQSQFESWWKSEDPEKLVELRNYCEQHAVYYRLDQNRWMSYDEIAGQLPRGSLRFRDLTQGYERNFADFNYQYLIRVFETAKSSDEAPVSLISDQAKMIILHERKVKLLEKLKQELYDRAIRSNSIKIMTK